MDERLQHVSEIRPRPAWGENPLNDFVDQHVREAHRLRAEVVRNHAVAVGSFIRSLSWPIRRLKASVVAWFQYGLKASGDRQSEIGSHG